MILLSWQEKIRGNTARVEKFARNVKRHLFQAPPEAGQEAPPCLDWNHNVQVFVWANKPADGHQTKYGLLGQGSDDKVSPKRLDPDHLQNNKRTHIHVDKLVVGV